MSPAGLEPLVSQGQVVGDIHYHRAVILRARLPFSLGTFMEPYASMHAAVVKEAGPVFEASLQDRLGLVADVEQPHM